MKSIEFDLRVKWYFLKRIIDVLNATRIITASHSSIPWYYCLNHIANWFSPHANYSYNMIYCVFQSLENTMSLRLSVNLQHSFLADENNIVYRYFDSALAYPVHECILCAQSKRLRSCLTWYSNIITRRNALVSNAEIDKHIVCHLQEKKIQGHTIFLMQKNMQNAIYPLA